MKELNNPQEEDNTTRPFLIAMLVYLAVTISSIYWILSTLK